MSNAIESFWYLVKDVKLSATCAANSRVGVRISERGIRALARPEARISIIGRVKDAVFPVPVCADPITSRPIKTIGIDFS